MSYIWHLSGDQKMDSVRGKCVLGRALAGAVFGTGIYIGEALLTEEWSMKEFVINIGLVSSQAWDSLLLCCFPK